jgi:hypothetical protein
MKQQVLICNDDIDRFATEVNEFLKDGWTFVPTSLQISTSMTENAFVAILEKE